MRIGIKDSVIRINPPLAERSWRGRIAQREAFGCGFQPKADPPPRVEVRWSSCHTTGQPYRMIWRKRGVKN